MNTHSLFITLISALILSLTACKDHQSEVNTKPETTTSAVTQPLVTDQWLGQWNGPEGTFLKINGGNGKYEIIIQNLDGPQTYTGISIDNGIQFERNGVMEKIEATNGEGTGMKWLSEKSNCLTIHKGEGFCRD